jgi:hypothetical protein
MPAAKEVGSADMSSANAQAARAVIDGVFVSLGLGLRACMEVGQNIEAA